MCADCDWESAADKAESILSKLEELPDRAHDFSTSVDERVRSMLEWIDAEEHVTEKMVASLENTGDAVDRWLR